MRNSLFKKAYTINKSIVITHEDDSSVIAEIAGSTEQHSVILKYEDYTFKHSCNCRLMSMRNPDLICSHKLALFFHLIKREEQKDAQ